MAEQRLGWSEWKDLRFFLHWEGIAVVLGGVGLVAFEFWEIPLDWPLAWFVEDYRLWIVIALALLVGLPPTIARGLDHLRARDEAARAQVEVGTVLYAIELRLLNLVSKIREAFAGQHTNTYQHHTLNECKSYFSTRASEVAKTCIIDVNYYRLTRSGSAISLERALFTGSAHSRMRSTFSNAPGASREAKRLVKTISEGNSVFCPDVTEVEHTEALHIKDGADRPYRTFLTVPVFRDKKSGASERVIGMLSINSTHVDTLSASDAAILKVYAWLLAAAFEADGLAKRLPPECRVTSDDRGTLVVREIGAE
ncbi:GAF domain-containing protein [Microbacterium sp. NPDC088796]